MKELTEEQKLIIALKNWANLKESSHSNPIANSVREARNEMREQVLAIVDNYSELGYKSQCKTEVK